MIDVSKDIRSLTEFKTKTPEFLEDLRKKRRALLLTVNGRAELAVMSAATFQEVLEELDTLDAIRGIQQGLAEVEAGLTRPFEESSAAIRRKLGLPPRGGLPDRSDPKS